VDHDDFILKGRQWRPCDDLGEVIRQVVQTVAGVDVKSRFRHESQKLSLLDTLSQSWCKIDET
jgi:hypothetical protein